MLFITYILYLVSYVKLLVDKFVTFFLYNSQVSLQGLDEKLKAKLVLKLCLFFSIFALLFSPTVFLVSPLFFIAIILLIGTNIGTLFAIKKTGNIYSSTVVFLISNFLFIATVHVFTGRPEGLSIVLWYIVVALSASFILNKEWALFFTIAAFLMIGTLTIAEHFNFIDHSSNRINTTQRLWSFPLRIGLPFFLIYLIAKEFVNNRIKAIKDAKKLIHHQNELNTQISVSEKFYRSILEEAEDIIYELDNKGRYNYINPAGLKLTGYTRAELYKMSFTKCLLETDRIKHQRQLVQQLKQRQPTSYMQFRIRTKGDEVIWIGQTTKIIFDDKGSYQRSFCVARNITKQKQEKLILNRAKEEAVRLNQAKNNFLAMMGHELRTPLNAIIGIGHHLLDNHPTKGQKEGLKTILFSSNNLLNLINDILDFTLIEQSKFTLKQKAFDLAEILHQTVTSYHTQLHEALSVELNIDKVVPTQLIGDVDRLLQILNNLLQNAIKFTENGTVAINVKLQAYKNNQPQIYFEVKDTGIGIAAANLENIFERFTQLDNSLKRNYGGMGLGLSIVKKLLNKMDSDIQVTSEPNKGSTFFFILSFKKQSIAALKNTPKQFPKNILAGATVLLVEDNKINQLVAKKLLLKWKTKVIVAENGAIGVEKAQNQEYDIILMDLEMPVMNGLEATKNIRLLPNYQDKPIIAVTASSTRNIKVDLKKYQFTDLVQKPFKPATLFHSMALHYKKGQTKIWKEMNQAVQKP